MTAAERDEFGDRSACTLAAGHVGRHSFVFGGDEPAGGLEPVLLPDSPDPATLTPMQRHNRAVLAAAGLTAEVYLEMESLQYQEEIFGVVSTRHFGVQTSVAVPQLTHLAATTRGLSAAVALEYLAVTGRPLGGGDTLPSDSAFVSLTDTGRAVLARLTPQLQD
ncbi:hypothetical protein [Amycolatopsis sp. NPDC050768]|uniref:hypothetical protein n=1 Tax=Amycolatopsis sp. NPDC050768 TaxID=3154839 RepID=UPI0033CA7C1A